MERTSAVMTAGERRKQLEVEYSRILDVNATPWQVQQARLKAAREAE